MIFFKETYDLPDIQILSSEKDFDYYLWQPDKLYIILGRSDNYDTAVNEEEASKANATILKRPSGGHSVVVSEKTLVISAMFKQKMLNTKFIFETVNSQIISSLMQLGVENIIERGISDICIGEKKILGSSIYKKIDRVFYHAVLNISEDIYLIDKLLKHPVREPDYRKGRSHSDFVTSIQAEGYNFKIDEIASVLSENFENFAKNIK